MSSKHKHEKKTNVINRTTSETLRVSGDSELRILQTNPTNSRKKIQNSSSSFQITGVSMTRTDGDDSADDLDTDDISRVTDNETPSFSEDSRDTDDHQLEAAMVLEPPQQELKPKTSDERFKIVKIASTTPFSRGRWLCVDYFDDTEKSLQKVQHERATARQEQGISSKGKSETYVFTSPLYHQTMQQNLNVATKPAGILKGFPQGYKSNLTSEGMEPINIQNQDTIVQFNQKAAIQPSTVNGQKDDILSDIKVALTMPASNSGRSNPSLTATCNFRSNQMSTDTREIIESPSGSDEDLSVILSNDDFNEATVFAVYCFIKKFVGSASNNNNIDRKIEEALDAVKTHLMVAVHKEVDFLKTRVSTLEGRVNELEIENSILRVNYLLFKS